MKNKNPIAMFQAKLGKAERKKIPLANAFSLATVSPSGKPSSRMMLLKGADSRGFIFYTNLKSRKGKEISENQFASLCFWWPVLGEQVRVEGKVKCVNNQEADRYFATRSRGSQIGAWASKQSTVLKSRGELRVRVKIFEKKFKGMKVPRPPFWSGFIVVPSRIEFWRGMPDRLHVRTLYVRSGSKWKVKSLYP